MSQYLSPPWRLLRSAPGYILNPPTHTTYYIGNLFTLNTLLRDWSRVNSTVSTAFVLMGNILRRQHGFFSEVYATCTILNVS
jgi:hypothetical protein